MQIIDKGQGVTVKLTQEEGRRLRDASYIINRLAANVSLSPAEMPQELETLYRQAHLIPNSQSILRSLAGIAKLLADKYTPVKSQEKLDRQDSESVPDRPVVAEAAGDGK